MALLHITYGAVSGMINYGDFFLPLDNKEYQDKIFNEVIELGNRFYSGELREGKVLSYRSPKELKSIVKESLPKKGVGIEGTLDILKDPIAKYSIAQFDQNYLAFPDSGNCIPAMVGDIFAKFLNQNMIAFSRSAPIATFIEIQLLEWLRELIGYEYKSLDKINSLSEVSGMVTTGGHMSNHIAILSALNKQFPEIKMDGLTGIRVKPTIILSGAIAHYSFTTASHHLGIGRDAIVSAESSEDFTTNIESVEELLKNPPKGRKPFMVVGVAGNAKTSQLDNLRLLADLCEKYKVWFHVDACHGGSLLFSQSYRSLLDGIERADSVSLDPHKGLFLPYPLSFVMFKRRDTLTEFTRYDKEVRDGSSWDLGYITPFYGSRGFESLKMYLTIKALGVDSIGKIMDDRQELAKQVAVLIRKSKLFSIFNAMEFYRMSFVYYPEKFRKLVDRAGVGKHQRIAIKKVIDEYTHRINEELYISGKLSLDEFKLNDLGNSTGLDIDDKFTVISVTIGNPKLGLESVRQSLQELFMLCSKYEDEFGERIEAILGDFEISEEKSDNTNFGPAGW